ncbi:MAG: hypothetical protein ABFS39_05285 [Pseudomonadota bacterium]
MNRRSKLNLTPDQEVPKKQPVGFEKNEAKGDETMQETQQTQKPHVAGATATEPQIELPDAAGWMDGKKLLKVALVVAAAGLSIYFLKRRLYP